MSELQRNYAAECSTQFFFFTVMARKLSPFPEEISGEYQCGFCPGRSSTEQIFILRQSLEKWYEYGIDVNTLFTDYKQAFDSIDKYGLQRSLKS